jgi:hypothetical protein
MTATEPDVLDLLRAIDPIDPVDPLAQPGQAHADAARLAQVQRVVQLRRAYASPPASTSGARGRWRVAAIVVAAVVAAPVGLVAMLPGVASRLGLPWVTSVAVLGSEAADRLCDGGGHATAIPPSQASLRLWPGELPSGWTVTAVFARDIDVSRSGCVVPSMVLAETTADNVVVGSVRVVGPRTSVSLPGDPEFTTDRVAGRPAREVTYPGMEVPDFRRWLVTGPGGLTWELDAAGLTESRARQIADSLSFTTTHVDYRAEPGSPVSVLYRRTGPPYPTRASGGLEWYVNFRDASGHVRGLSVRRSPLRLPLGSEEIAPGSRLRQVEGRPAVENPGSLTVEVRPGVLASTEVRGDLPAIEQLLGSLVNLDSDDPRLQRYALDEHYGR